MSTGAPSVDPEPPSRPGGGPPSDPSPAAPGEERGRGAPPGTERVRRLARLLDAAVRIPGTDVRFGLDAVLGLIPGGGDVAGAVLSAWIVLTAARLGAPLPVLLRMTGNLALDVVLGAVPVVGDLVDVGWKANLRNVALLERHVSSPERTRRRSVLALGGVAGALLALLGLLGWAVWLAIRTLLGSMA